VGLQWASSGGMAWMALETAPASPLQGHIHRPTLRCLCSVLVAMEKKMTGSFPLFRTKVVGAMIGVPRSRYYNMQTHVKRLLRRGETDHKAARIGAPLPMQA
jgi:hypothetical protein